MIGFDYGNNSVGMNLITYIDRQFKKGGLII
jgi:hypothetical protein